MAQIQLRQYMDAHNRQAEMIGNLRAELIMYRHLAVQAASALEQLKHRLLSHYDAHSASAQDRAALLDADLVLAEAYKLTQKEEAVVKESLMTEITALGQTFLIKHTTK